MKKLLIALACTGLTLSAHAFELGRDDIDSALKSKESGVGRFRGGWYGAIGASAGDSKGTEKLGKARLAGMSVTGGVYGLFNPIRDFADIEGGLGLSSVIPMSAQNNNGTSYSYGQVAATAYAGPVFRMPNGLSSFGIGAYIEQPIKTLIQSQDRLLNNSDLKLKPALGIYGEYQYSKGAGKEIYFVRGSYSKTGIKSSTLGAEFNLAGESVGVLGVVFGVKL